MTMHKADRHGDSTRFMQHNIVCSDKKVENNYTKHVYVGKKIHFSKEISIAKRYRTSDYMPRVGNSRA